MTLFAGLCAIFGCSAKGFESVGADEFARKIAKEGVQLVDVRTASEYAEGHIPNAVNIDIYSPDFAEKIAKIRELLPDAFIGVDVIVGTRGESEELFEEAYNFIKGLDITELHVFSYSERPGTQALKIAGAVSPAEKHRRSRLLIELSEEKRRAFYARHIGREAVVLFEKPRPGMPISGFTANYIRVETENNPAFVNRLVRVRLGDFSEDTQSLMVSEVVEIL